MGEGRSYNLKKAIHEAENLMAERLKCGLVLMRLVAFLRSVEVVVAADSTDCIGYNSLDRIVAVRNSRTGYNRIPRSCQLKQQR